MAKTRTKLDPAHVQLQLKITLLDIRPAIWRRLLVPATIKLPKLHPVLQRAFGWTNSHLHAFRRGRIPIRPIPPRLRSPSYSARTPNIMTKRSSGSATCSMPPRTG